MPDNGFVSDEDGMAAAVAAFAKDEAPAPVPQPAPTPPPQVPTEPEPQKEPEEEPEPLETKEAAEKAEPEKMEEEFVEFQGKQKERFNSVYGKMRSYERENLDLQRRIQQFQQIQQEPQPVVPQPQFQPQQISGPAPKLENFPDADSWGAELVRWTKDQTLAELRIETSRERTLREQQEFVQQQNAYINGRIAEGRKKVGLKQFDEAAKEILPYAPHYSTMYNELFQLERFPEVVVHLSKNVELADHISSLDQKEQIVELRLLERKLALAAKSPQKLPTKVEAPGNGDEPAKPSATLSKLRAAAKASGNVKDFAAIFQADPTL